MIRWVLKRYAENSDATIGILHRVDKPLAFTLEDQRQAVKVKNETRIPSGEYTLTERKFGGFYERYKRRCSWHYGGVVEISGVPGCTDILIHVGNTDDDTSGCILLGNSANISSYTISYSVACYKEIYPLLIEDIRGGGAKLAVQNPN